MPLSWNIIHFTLFFREKWERINVSWTEDGEEVNFGTKKTYFFRPDLSYGSEDDLISLPNIPMIVSDTLEIFFYYSNVLYYSYGIVLKLCHYIPFVFPFQSALRSMKYSGDLVKVAFTSMLEILKQTIIAEYKVKDVLWGIDHPLVKLANDILPEVSL